MSGFRDQGEDAIAIGYQSGQTNQGTEAIAIGDLAGNNSQSSSAIAIGFAAGRSNQGINSIAIGKSASETNAGVGSIAIGTFAGANNSFSTVINSSGVALSSAADNATYIKPLRSNIGTNNMQYNPTSGEVSYTTSTRDSKKDIQDLENTHNIYQLKPRTFYFKDGTEQKQYGLIAEEVDEIDSNLVYKNNDKPTDIVWSALTTSLLSEVQRLNKELQIVKDKLNIQ